MSDETHDDTVDTDQDTSDNAAATPLESLSDQLADVVEAVGPSLVQVSRGRRVATGVIWPGEPVRVVTTARVLGGGRRGRHGHKHGHGHGHKHVHGRGKGWGGWRRFAEEAMRAYQDAAEDEPGEGDEAPERAVQIRLGSGQTRKGTVRGVDPGTELALIELEDTSGLTPARVDDRPERLRVGHLVLTLGRPGESVRATLGLISALGGSWRTHRGARIDRFYDVDGTLPPGFAGGALVSPSGGILGVNVRGLVQGGTTVPAETVERVVQSLASGDRHPRGFLGVGVQQVRLPADAAERLGRGEGLLVTAVEPESPADDGGVLLGDVLVALAGEPLTRHADLLGSLGDKGGTEVEIEVIRAGAPVTLKVVLGERRGRRC